MVNRVAVNGEFFKIVKIHSERNSLPQENSPAGIVNGEFLKMEKIHSERNSLAEIHQIV